MTQVTMLHRLAWRGICVAFLELSHGWKFGVDGQYYRF